MPASDLHSLVLPAGKLNRRIAFQRLVRVTLPSGGSTTTWQTVSGCERVPAEVRPWKGWEVMASGQLTPTNQERFRIRFRPGITADMQILYNQRTFNIRNIANEEEADMVLEILCEERRAGTPGGNR
jgi:SPP1 family predicted phage head-tail adaptor